MATYLSYKILYLLLAIAFSSLLRQFKTAEDVPAPYAPNTKALVGIYIFYCILPLFHLSI